MNVVPFRGGAGHKTVVDLRGRVLRAGPFLESLGYGERVYRMSVLDLTHPEDHGVSRAVHRWLCSGYRRLIVSERWVAVDGGIRPATLHVELAVDSRGRAYYVRAWPAGSGQGWGAASAMPFAGDAREVSILRDGFVVEPLARSPIAGAVEAEARAIVLPPELL